MRIAVITPAFNAAAWIGQAIRSVLVQTHADWRMAVVDDGSGDGTGAVAAGFADRRVRVIRQRNAGVSAARNRGLRAMDADAFLFLDADDWLVPDALAELDRALAAEPGAVAAAGAARFVGAQAGATTRRGLRPAGGALLPRLLVRNPFANGGHLLLRAGAVRNAGAFRTDLAYGEDWEYWVRIALQGRFAAARNPTPLLHVRERAEGAYARHAADPAAIRPCLDAMFANPMLETRFTPARLQTLRRQAEAESAWVAGRTRLRNGDVAAGRHWLLRSLAASPSARRAALLAVLWARGLLPGPPVPRA